MTAKASRSVLAVRYYLRQNISLDAHVNGDEGGALLVPLPEQLLRLGQCLLLHQVLKSVPPSCIGDHRLQQETRLHQT